MKEPKPRPAMHLTEAELEELPEYSCTVPDSYARPLSEGGRRWRRREPYGEEDCTWYIGEYVRTPELTAKGLIGIRWYDVILRPTGTPFRGRVATYAI